MPATFVDDGRGLSRWEPKVHHDWWRNVTEVVGTYYDAKGHGLSVTPNLLHGDLAAQTLTYMRNGSQGSSTKALMSWKMRRPMSVPWTEYSLYTTVAELQGNLFDYHVEWNTCYGARRAPVLRAVLRLGRRRFRAAGQAAQRHRPRRQVHHRAKPRPHPARARARILPELRRVSKTSDLAVVLADLRRLVRCRPRVRRRS